MTYDQVLWAAKHDWFLSYRHEGQAYSIKALENCRRPDGNWVRKEVVFHDVRALRAWAGY